MSMKGRERVSWSGGDGALTAARPAGLAISAALDSNEGRQTCRPHTILACDFFPPGHRVPPSI